jgi:hypothetical protein
MITTNDKIKAFAQLVETQQIQRLNQDRLACDANIANAKTSIKSGTKYVKVDIGHSGRFMIEVETGNIFGIKAYGQIHRGHFYGTLDTINEYNWGDYYPHKLENPIPTQRGGIPKLTTVPELTAVSEQTT